jgi:hypothetical protein
LRSFGIRSSTVPARVSPIPVAIAIALHQALGILLAVARAGQALDLQLHQSLGGKADHLAQKVGVGGLLDERSKVHPVIGHRWFLGCGWSSQPMPLHLRQHHLADLGQNPLVRPATRPDEVQ